MDWTSVPQQVARLSRTQEVRSLAEAARFLLEALQAELVVIRSADDGVLPFASGAGIGVDAARAETPGIGEVFRTTDFEQRLPRIAFRAAAGDSEGLPSASVVMPLFDGDEFKGGLSVTFSAGRRLADDEIGLISTVGGSVAELISLTQSLQTVEQRERRNARLIEVMSIAARGGGLKEMLRQICCLVAGQSVGERSSVLLYREGERRLVPVMCQTKDGTPVPEKDYPGRRAVWVDAIITPSPVVA
ncbi:MAG: hypothetical protein ACREQV_13105, partial [Candidatus Binatia bacterium]